MFKKAFIKKACSVRTKFSLGTAFVLLLLLLTFYLGGRYVLIRMIRDAEKEVQIISTDVKRSIYSDFSRIQQFVHLVSSDLSLASRPPNASDINRFLSLKGDYFNIHIAFILNPDGSLFHGSYFVPGITPETPLQASELEDYRKIIKKIGDASHDSKSGVVPSGIIRIKDIPFSVAIASFKSKETNQVAGILVVGSVFRKNDILAGLSEKAAGMQIRLNERNLTRRLEHDVPNTDNFSIFNTTQNYESGSTWHLGDNVFEAVMPIHDLCGDEISTITISLPRTFASVTTIALGWLTSFIALIGVVAIIPIFWLQTRLLLNPLSSISEQIASLGENHANEGIKRLEWNKKDEFGALVHSVNSMLDTLDERREQIFQSEQNQRAILMCMPDGLCVFDSKSRLVSIKKQPDGCEPIPGLEIHQPLPGDFFSSVDREAFSNAINAVLTSGGMMQTITMSCSRGANVRKINVRISKMFDTMVLVIFRDVTQEFADHQERLDAEKRLLLVQKQESLSMLAAGVAHDVNTMLTIILTTIENTWSSNNDAKIQKAISTIRLAIVKGSDMVREFMNYAGDSQYNFTNIEPNSVISENQQLLISMVPPKVVLDVKLGKNLPKIKADSKQIWKVFLNLIKNASESMANRNGAITISTSEMTMTKEESLKFFCLHTLQYEPGVLFEVADMGSGISDSIKRRIFEPFFSTKAAKRGLGLATVLTVVDAHSGAVAVDSVLGKGSTFKVWLPAVVAPVAKTKTEKTVEEKQETEVVTPIVTAPTEKKTINVLVVEDEPIILSCTTRLITRILHYNVYGSSTQSDTMSVLHRNGDILDVVLLDAHLGDFDSTRILRFIRSINPSTKIVIVSGSSETRIKEMFANHPYDAFIAKPYAISELKTIIEKLYKNEKKESSGMA